MIQRINKFPDKEDQETLYNIMKNNSYFDEDAYSKLSPEQNQIPMNK